jgi:TPR repeat protein
LSSGQVWLEAGIKSCTGGDSPGGTIAAASDPSFHLTQAGSSPTLPSLVLPPSATSEPEAFAAMMRLGDAAMVRGDITRARALYERAAALRPNSSAALVAAGKTYDPNILPLFGGSSLADVAKAKERYERARALGNSDAAALLKPLQ